MSSEKRHHAILGRLERSSTHGADALVAAAAASGALETLLSELDPLIGDRGVRALYGRSVQLCKVSFPWLTSVDAPETGLPPAADLRARLEDRSAHEVHAASAALLLTLTDLLAVLIGEPLTHRILLAAWKTQAQSPLESKP